MNKRTLPHENQNEEKSESQRTRLGSLQSVSEYLRLSGLAEDPRIFDGIFAQSTAGLFGLLSRLDPNIESICPYPAFFATAKNQKFEVLEQMSDAAHSVEPYVSLLTLALRFYALHVGRTTSNKEEANQLAADAYSNLYLLKPESADALPLELTIDLGVRQFKVEYRLNDDEIEISWED